jgi:phosphopantothenoylcysteine synthetase/decarboxylase
MWRRQQRRLEMADQKDQKDPTELLLERITDLRKEAKSLAKNPAVSSAALSRLVSEDMVPSLATLAKFVVDFSTYVDETLDEFEDRLSKIEGPVSQLIPEDAAKLIAHLTATNQVLKGLVDASPTADGAAAVKELLSNGEACIKVIQEIIVEPEDEDEDDDEDEDEDDEDEEDDDDEDDEDEDDEDDGE